MHKLKGNTDADPTPVIIKNLKHSIFWVFHQLKKLLDTNQAGNIPGLKKKKNSSFYLSLGILIETLLVLYESFILMNYKV